MLDGVDPWSDNPVERMRYAVYRRRMTVRAAETQAVVAAAAGSERCEDVLKEYFDMQLPESSEAAMMRLVERDRMLAEVEKMEPIPLSSIRIGMPIGGDGVTVTEEARPPPAVKTFGTGR